MATGGSHALELGCARAPEAAWVLVDGGEAGLGLLLREMARDESGRWGEVADESAAAVGLEGGGERRPERPLCSCAWRVLRDAARSGGGDAWSPETDPDFEWELC